MNDSPFTKRRGAAMIGSVRPTKLDVALTLLVSAFAVWLGLEYAAGTEIEGTSFKESAAVAPLFLLITLPLLLRSQAPLQALALSLAGLAIHAVAFGSLWRCGPVYLIAFLLAYSSAFRLPRKQALAGLLLAHALCMLMSVAGDGTTGLVLQPFVLLAWAAGRFAHSRAKLNQQLDERTVALRAARDERAKLEVATDRARLSGELDELLKRRLSDLARLAEAGRSETDPVSAAKTLADIERDSRSTLEEMRQIVGVLRSENGDAAVSPPPTLAHLEALLLRAKGAGARLTVAGDPRVLPAGVELSAYRVVEHLLEALDDAPDVSVEVSFESHSLGLKVSGPTRRRDLGPSVERARERVQLHRGTLSTSLRAGRAEAVAQLPVGAVA